MQYKLLTNSDGTCIAKTSFGMFDDMEIETLEPEGEEEDLEIQVEEI